MFSAGLFAMVAASIVAMNGVGEAAVATDTWGVIVCASRYWFNYRHLVNSLIIYRLMKSGGVPDNQIIFMNALSDLPYNSRNVAPGKVINSNTLDYGFDELYEGTEVDYSRSETTVDSFLQVLTGRGHSTSGRKVLQSSESSKVLIYLTGHGGDQFLKFQDNEELTSEDLGKAIKEMELKHMFGEMLLIADTCQASTMADHITSPNVTILASSGKGENSYSFYSNDQLGVSVIDRFVFQLQKYVGEYIFTQLSNTFETNSTCSATLRKSAHKQTLGDLVRYMDRRFLRSNVVVRDSSAELDGRSEHSTNWKRLQVAEFFVGSSCAEKLRKRENPTQISKLSDVDITRRNEHTTAKLSAKDIDFVYQEFIQDAWS